MKVVHSLVPSQSSDSPSSHGATGNAYGYLSSYPTLVLSLPDLRELVQLISEHLDVETPFVFSNGGSTVSQGGRGVPLAIDLDAGRVKRLIDKYVEYLTSKSGRNTNLRKSGDHIAGFDDEARFAGPHELEILLRWGLARVGAAWRPHLTVSLFRISYCPPPSAIPSSSTSTAPDPTSFESTCTAYLRSVHATEHYLLSFIRWQDTPTSLSGGGSGAGGIPGRLKEWIKDYPRTLSGHARVFAIADLCWEAVDSEIENNIVLDREMEHRLYEDAPPMYALGPNTTGSSQIQSFPPSSELLQAVADHPEPLSREKFEYALQLRMSQVAVLEYVEGAEGAADKLPKVFQWIAEKRGMNGDQTHGCSGMLMAASTNQDRAKLCLYEHADLQTTKSLRSKLLLPLPPIATMAELMTTTVSQHHLPLPPQTVLADILVPEGDAASKLPNNHKSRGMNENFQASLADYTSDFSGVLHYNENFE
ncbi:hypothetical protein HHX47_DHR4000133 [Lentinula edodes]|nr:hypothetical protein HHX47_DHR4000133 [Lentinula edodes]